MEREKALDVAIGQIEKQFGKGAIMRMGADQQVKVAAIPTGALSLDVALGIGGLPRGRVVEIYGPESSGKCLTGDTWIWTDRGLETVAELFARCGQTTDAATRITDIRDLDVRAVNEHGELEQVAALTHNGAQPVLRIHLMSGRSVSVTANHPLRVLDEKGEPAWRQAQAITVGDVVVSAAFGALEAAAGDGIAEDEAALLGYLVAQRSVLPAPGCDDEAAVECRRLVRQLDGAARGGIVDDDVPQAVRLGGPKAQRAFLSALFETGGVAHPPASAAGVPAGLRLVTTSEALARQVQLLLFGFGIPARVWGRTGEVRDGWGVTVRGEDAQRFLDEIGLRSERRRAQAQEDLGLAAGDADASSAPGHSPGARTARYVHERVVAVEDGGRQPTFDLMLPGTHSFLANGILSHNTTVALHAVAEAQRIGGIAAFIDAEHALDPVYAKALGVDVDALLVSQPDTGEQALEITDMLVRSGAVDIVVIDSVAALTPRAEIEGEMGDTHVGLQARLMSQALRKLAGTLSRSRTCAVFINQIREKVGVMFGCFSGDTLVTLADGSQERIGRIVDERLPVEVLSYDHRSGRVVPRKVVSWFDNGPTEGFLAFTVAGTTGTSTFSCTPNHRIRTPYGWQEARELTPGDAVLQAMPCRLSDPQWDALLGMLLGGAQLIATAGGSGVRLRWGRTDSSADYTRWKASLFGNLDLSQRMTGDGAVLIDTEALPELAELREAVSVTQGVFLSHDYLKRLTPLSLALWYLDNGSLQHGPAGTRAEVGVDGIEPTSRRRLRDRLADEWRLYGELGERAGEAVLRFPPEATARLHALIAPFVSEPMEHALLPDLRGRCSFEPVFAEPRNELVRACVVDIRRASAPAGGPRPHRYDIEVEGTHNYFVDGVMVHNSPETQPGGRALKFYSSVRLDVRRIESLKDGTDFVGNRVRVKVVKNKCASPFKQAEFDILFGEGISKEGSILDMAADNGIIKKAGAWYSYEGDQIGQGREQARTFLKEHPDTRDEIYKRVTEHLGLVPTDITGGESLG